MNNVNIKTSWDDGSIQDIKAVELCAKYGIPAMLYITIDYVGTEGHLTWDQIKQLATLPHVTIGSHTMTHPSDLKAIFNDELFVEIQTSKDSLEAVLNKPVTSFCYPRGRFDNRVKAMVQEAGYTEARTTLVGALNEGTDPFAKPTSVHVYEGRKEYNGVGWYSYGSLLFNQMKPGDIFHLWGHGWEVERDKQWNKLEEFFKRITQ